jgi:hypothetical protein
MWEQDGPGTFEYHLFLRRISSDGRLSPPVSVLPEGELLTTNSGEPTLSTAPDGAIAVSWLATLSNRGTNLPTRPEMRFIARDGTVGQVIQLEPARRGHIPAFSVVVHAVSGVRAITVIAGPHQVSSELVDSSGVVSHEHVLLAKPGVIALAGNATRAVVAIWSETGRSSSIYAVDLTPSTAGRAQLLAYGVGNRGPTPYAPLVAMNDRGAACVVWVVGLPTYPFQDGSRAAFEG